MGQRGVWDGGQGQREMGEWQRGGGAWVRPALVSGCEYAGSIHHTTARTASKISRACSGRSNFSSRCNVAARSWGRHRSRRASKQSQSTRSTCGAGEGIEVRVREGEI
eukprot:scaffold34565_cov84-Isochrysis_galbana.AAC.1